MDIYLSIYRYIWWIARKQETKSQQEKVVEQTRHSLVATYVCTLSFYNIYIYIYIYIAREWERERDERGREICWSRPGSPPQTAQAGPAPGLPRCACVLCRCDIYTVHTQTSIDTYSQRRTLIHHSTIRQRKHQRRASRLLRLCDRLVEAYSYDHLSPTLNKI